MRTFGIPILVLLQLAGCASVNSFVNSTGDLASGRTARSVEESRQQQVVATRENASLRTQSAALQSQRVALRGQLSAAQAHLRAVSEKLKQENAGTQEQRNEYARLVDKQRELQQRLTAASAAPAPTDSAAMADQKAQLSELTQEKDVLERQVNALQRAL